MTAITTINSMNYTNLHVLPLPEKMSVIVFYRLPSGYRKSGQ